MDKRVSAAEETAKAVLASLPKRTDEADAVLAKYFTQSVPAFRQAARAAFQPGQSNASLVQTSEAVHELLVSAVANFRALEFWLQTKVPQLSDGNNFGVEVQDFVIEKIKAARTQCMTHADGLSNWEWQRGLGIEKLGATKSTDKSTVETSESKNEDGTNKETKTKKEETTTKVGTKEGLDDFVLYVVETDVKQYVALEGAVRELIASYVRIHALVNLNMDKCVNPRGTGNSGGRVGMY